MECPNCGSGLKKAFKPSIAGLVGCAECLAMFWPEELKRFHDEPALGIRQASTYDPLQDHLGEPFPEEI